MLLQAKRRQKENSKYNEPRTFAMILLALMAMDTVMSVTEAKVAHSGKASINLLKTSSSSLLQSSSLTASSAALHYRRFKRDTLEGDDNDDNEYLDENYDVIPVMTGSGDSPKSVREHISEQAKQIAESFSQLWQSVTESVNRCVDAIRQLFASGGDMPLTPEQEEQLRAAMEARGKAIEEQNELYRNTYENQI